MQRNYLLFFPKVCAGEGGSVIKWGGLTFNEKLINWGSRYLWKWVGKKSENTFLGLV